MAGSAQDIAGNVGGAVSDLFGAAAARASATSYTQASEIASENVQLTKQATDIQQVLNTRNIYKAISTQEAQVGGAGFSESGSALDLLKASTANGALTKAMTAEQGAITENAYAAQAGLYAGLAGAAKTSATGQIIGGVIQGAGAAYNAAKLVSAAPASTDIVAPAAGIATDTYGAAAGFATPAADVAIGAGAVDASAAGIAAAGDVGATAAASGGLDIAAIATAAIGWIICTELHKQGRMPTRIYIGAAPIFAHYPERGKRGYYVWAIPSVKHLRAYPDSWYSRLLERTFNARAQYLFAHGRGRPTTWQGAAITHGLYGFCWALSWFVPARFADWTKLETLWAKS